MPTSSQLIQTLTLCRPVPVEPDRLLLVQRKQRSYEESATARSDQAQIHNLLFMTEVTIQHPAEHLTPVPSLNLHGIVGQFLQT